VFVFFHPESRQKVLPPTGILQLFEDPRPANFTETKLTLCVAEKLAGRSLRRHNSPHGATGCTEWSNGIRGKGASQLPSSAYAVCGGVGPLPKHELAGWLKGTMATPRAGDQELEVKPKGDSFQVHGGCFVWTSEFEIEK